MSSNELVNAGHSSVRELSREVEMRSDTLKTPQCSHFGAVEYCRRNRKIRGRMNINRLNRLFLQNREDFPGVFFPHKYKPWGVLSLSVSHMKMYRCQRVLETTFGLISTSVYVLSNYDRPDGWPSIHFKQSRAHWVYFMIPKPFPGVQILKSTSSHFCVKVYCLHDFSHLDP